METEVKATSKKVTEWEDDSMTKDLREHTAIHIEELVKKISKTACEEITKKICEQNLEKIAEDILSEKIKQFKNDRLTPKKAADILGMSEYTFKKHLREDNSFVPHYTVGRKTYIRLSQLELWIEAEEKKNKTKTKAD